MEKVDSCSSVLQVDFEAPPPNFGKAVGVVTRAPTELSLSPQDLTYKSRIEQLCTLLARLVAKLQSLGTIEACWADELFVEDMMEYWQKHVRAITLGVVLRMFGLDDKADQVSRAKTLCARKILVVPLEILGLWLRDKSVASSSVNDASYSKNTEESKIEDQQQAITSPVKMITMTEENLNFLVKSFRNNETKVCRMAQETRKPYQGISIPHSRIAFQCNGRKKTQWFPT